MINEMMNEAMRESFNEGPIHTGQDIGAGINIKIHPKR